MNCIIQNRPKETAQQRKPHTAAERKVENSEDKEYAHTHGDGQVFKDALTIVQRIIKLATKLREIILAIC